VWNSPESADPIHADRLDGLGQRFLKLRRSGRRSTENQVTGLSWTVAVNVFALGTRNGPTSCYFASYEQCATTLSGVGGYCYKSPYYQGPPAARDKAVKVRRPRHP
jgi:hypothetical protein